MRLELAAVPSEKKNYKLRALIKRETQFFFIYSLSSLKKWIERQKMKRKKNVKQKSNITETGMEWKRFFLEICILDLKRKTEIANCDTYIVKVKFCRKETI